MKNLLIPLLAVFATASISAQADERYLPHIEWLVQNSDLEYNGEPLPTIRQMPYPELEVTMYGAEAVAQAEHQGYTLDLIRGGYDHTKNEMLYSDDVDPWDEANADIMVHELVHFLQYLKGEPECMRSLEKPAYKLHWKWVVEHGLEDTFIEPNWLFVFFLEQSCTNSDWRG